MKKQKHAAENVFVIEGDWTIPHVVQLEKEIAVEKRGRKHAAFDLDASGLERLDTAGAWLIRRNFPDARFIAGPGAAARELLDFVAAMPDDKKIKAKRADIRSMIAGIGESSVDSLKFLYDLVAFVGVIFARLVKNISSPRHFRIASITRHIDETGFRALPIIGLLAFGISTVIFYQGATQLQKFGADVFTIDLTVISLLREMAVLTTAIMVAGRSGSAFAAEIGVMKLRGEVDALRTMGVDPVEALVLPRLIALMLTLPVLGFFADIIGLAAGGLMSASMLDMPYGQYMARVQDVATPTMFFLGMVKTPVFAFLITAVCAYQGMHVTGSAENVGKITTLAVVQSIFLVIMADAVFSIVFSELGL